jgi:hypothetical protein
LAYVENYVVISYNGILPLAHAIGNLLGWDSYMSTVVSEKLTEETMEEITILVKSILSQNPPSTEHLRTQIRRIAEKAGLVYGDVVVLTRDRIDRRTGGVNHPSLRDNDAYQSLVRFGNRK